MLQKGSTSYELARYAAETLIPEQMLNKFRKEGDLIIKTAKNLHENK